MIQDVASRVALLLVSILWLAACSGAVLPTPTTVSTPTVAAVPTAGTSPTVVSTSPPDAILAVYQKSGCFAGVRDTLTVYSNGTLELVDRSGNKQQAHVPSNELTSLKQLLAQPDFAQLRPRYQAEGADLCVYTITAASPDEVSHTVTTMDAAQTPEFLSRLIQELDNLRARVK